MKFLRRTAVITAELLILFMLIITLLAPQQLIDALEAVDEVNFVIRLAILLVVSMMMLRIIASQFRSPRKWINQDDLKIKTRGTMSTIRVNSVTDTVLKAVREIPDVIAADARVKSVDGKADVGLDITIMGVEVNIPEKQREIAEVVKNTVTKKLGVKMVGNPQIDVRFKEGDPVEYQRQLLQQEGVSVQVLKPGEKKSGGFMSLPWGAREEDNGDDELIVEAEQIEDDPDLSQTPVT